MSAVRRSELRPVTGITKPLSRFLHIESASGVVLLVATVVAITAATTPLRELYASFWNLELTRGVGGWSLSYPPWYRINDGLMTVFFFLVGLEIKREIVSGELRDVRRLVSPAVAAFGGATVPAIIYSTIPLPESPILLTDSRALFADCLQGQARFSNNFLTTNLL